jgi:hypothetical protein
VSTAKRDRLRRLLEREQQENRETLAIEVVKVAAEFVAREWLLVRVVAGEDLRVAIGAWEPVKAQGQEAAIGHPVAVVHLWAHSLVVEQRPDPPPSPLAI